MLKKLLNEKTIQISDDLFDRKDWRKAITVAAQPLLEECVIKSTYVEAMIKNVEEAGPYINIGPKIALAHAKSSNDVNQVGISLLKTNSAVDLVNAEHPVTLWFVLAAPDDTSHLKLLQELTQLLMDKDLLLQLNEASTIRAIADIIESVNIK
ncbi:PTS sugar transporter subunit IIA [Weissella coleopterorum]|uniref:Ascorbate-specific PTS system EIIA component n=1 Tax=Weissella coleopterorum TaxID=2714949 RepID=A0A6G8B203_9LACO|nr:PTS sugar transporter subunit IIA [Weissella coleopterorum]QIL51173.1 PTS sugar transporter subunit IIA [Weissella coleopterorum]